MMKKLMEILVLAVLLQGCSLAPTYQRPALPVAEQWPQGDAYRSDTAAPSAGTGVELLDRGTFFADEKMRRVIDLALDNNRNLRQAVQNVERASALYGVQKAELYPALDAAGQGTSQRIPADLSTSGTSRIAREYRVTSGISAWEIDLFGRLRSLKDQALEEYLASEEAQRSVRIALVSQVGIAYQTLGADLELKKLAESTLATQDHYYRIVGQRYDSGVATRLDLRRAQISVETAREDVARYTQLAAQALNGLQLLAGTALPEALLPASLAEIVAPQEVVAGAVSEVLLQRPDVVAAEHRLRGAYANIGAARAAFFPRISLTTAAGTASAELSGLFDGGSGVWNFAPRLDVPIFDSRLWSRLTISKLDREIALSDYEYRIQIAFREVADALAVRGTIDQQITAHQDLVAANDETYRLTLERYQKGIDDYLGVLDSQRSLYSAEQGLVELRLAKRNNRVELYTVLGGGVN